MKHATLAALVLLAACAVVATPAHAALRSPQVAITGTGLQTFFTGESQTITVGSDQTDFQRWKSIGASSSLIIHLESSPNAGSNVIGIYNARELTAPFYPADPTLFPVFQGAASVGWFAEATFNSILNELHVVVRDAGSALVSDVTYNNVNTADFGYYIQRGDDKFFTEDKRHVGALPQALAYNTTPGYSGWWLCFEDSPAYAEGSDRDFDDAVLNIDAVLPTPVTKATWASVKARFR